MRYTLGLLSAVANQDKMHGCGLACTQAGRSERKRARVVEWTGLENQRRGNPSVSSNLTASATPLPAPMAELVDARDLKSLDH